MPGKTQISPEISHAVNLINDQRQQLARTADPDDQRAQGRIQGLTDALADIMTACTGPAAAPQLATSNGHATTY